MDIVLEAKNILAKHNNDFRAALREIDATYLTDKNTDEMLDAWEGLVDAIGVVALESDMKFSDLFDVCIDVPLPKRQGI